MPLKFSVNFEECSLRRTFPLKIFCVPLRQAPFCLSYSLQSICLAIFSLFLFHISLEGIMFDGWCHFHLLYFFQIFFFFDIFYNTLDIFIINKLSFICFFEVKTFQRKCGMQRILTNILQSLQRTSKSWCLRRQ